MSVREKIERRELLSLAPRAAKSMYARRARAEEPCDWRTAFQRDRDRILHSKSFRRLKQKTQVYIATGDHYRTRMTHSLEVSQIARTIARGLALNEDLVEAIALGHDVGHTPFGHAGEEALRRAIGHFEHNEQSLRVLEYIDNGGQGLNLTTVVKDGILNHTGVGVPQTQEGQIVKIADRIAYLCHDFDDSVRAGLLLPDNLPDSIVGVLGRTPSSMITAMVSDMIVASEQQGDICLSPDVQQAMDSFRSFMFESVYHSPALLEERKKAIFIVTNLHNYFLEHYDRLPPEFLRREQRWTRQQIVVDYIAGLTDLFAISLFEHIFVPLIDKKVK